MFSYKPRLVDLGERSCVSLPMRSKELLSNARLQTSIRRTNVFQVALVVNLSFTETDTLSLTTGMHLCLRADEPPEKINVKEKRFLVSEELRVPWGLWFPASLEKQGMVAGSATTRQSCCPLRVCMFYTWCVNGIAQYTAFCVCFFHLASFQGSSM